MAQADPLEMLRSVVQRVRDRVLEVVPAMPSASDPQAVKVARPLVSQVFDAWDALQAAFGDVAAKLGPIWSDVSLTDEARTSQTSAALRDVETSANSELTRMHNAANQLVDQLGPLARPPHPGAVDATSETRLAGLKSDWRMTLAPLDRLDVIDRVCRLLADAIATGDDLAVWALASSGWPALYLESRGLTERAFLDALDAEIAQLLDRAATGDTAIARKILALVEGGAGLKAAALAASRYVPIMVDELSGRRAGAA